MGMSALSCKSPEMCEKEIWIYLLASNIIRFFFIIAAHQVGKRAGRIEPKARKRRASAYSLLVVPRHQAKANI
jgi:hypothetical protein